MRKFSFLLSITIERFNLCKKISILQNQLHSRQQFKCLKFSFFPRSVDIHHLSISHVLKLMLATLYIWSNFVAVILACFPYIRVDMLILRIQNKAKDIPFGLHIFPINIWDKFLRYAWTYIQTPKQWPNLKNLSGGLNLSRGLNIVGST